MKRVFAIAIAILTLCSLTVLVASAKDNKLVAHYTFDETALKATVGKDGEAIGNPTVVAEGKFGGALSLDGSSAVHVVDSGLNFTGDVTISGWVKIHIPDDSGDFGFVMTDNWDNIGQIHCSFSHSGRVKVDIGDLWGKWAQQTNSEKYAIPDDEWALLTYVFDREGDKVTIYQYVNAVLVNICITSDTALAEAANGQLSLNNFTIGGFTNNGATDRWYTGLIDDLRIYEAALSADDVAALMNPPAGDEEAPSVIPDPVHTTEQPMNPPAGDEEAPSTFDPIVTVAIAAIVPAVALIASKKKNH
jgi:hypothetical protein